jgi:hypothetical protein
MADSFIREISDGTTAFRAQLREDEQFAIAKPTIR